MEKNPVQKLNEFGQSVWLDNINRYMIESRKIEDLVKAGLRGMTSNPTIFDKSIRLSNDYDRYIEKLSNAGKNAFEIYDELTIKDVQDAADIFRYVYDETDNLDGYVSLEIDPRFAFKVKQTIDEARRLFIKVNRPNVMFKIPATDEGCKAIETLVAEGININATLIFSIEQYQKTAQAYIDGLKTLLDKRKDPGRVRSVASVFVSRIDTAVDKILDQNKGSESLRGKAAIANSALIFQRYLGIFSADDFKALEKKGANIQRVLWASTSTKNPAYSDLKYVTGLMGKDTINTLPDDTFEAFLDHGFVKESLTSEVSGFVKALNELKKVGIDVDIVCKDLLKKGIISFEESFESLLDSVNKKALDFCKQ